MLEESVCPYVAGEAINAFPALKGGDFHCRRLTFQPDTQDVPRSIDVTIVRFAAAGANPVSYSNRAHTFGLLSGIPPQHEHVWEVHRSSTSTYRAPCLLAL
jgi:hypothetical protein